MTSQQAADYLGVAVSTVKRWADQGILPAFKTAGNHRRFDAQVVARFRKSGGRPSEPAAAAPTAGGVPPAARAAAGASPRAEIVRRPLTPAEFIDWLALADDARDSRSALIRARNQLGGWMPLVGLLERVLEEVGDRWRAGLISVAGEHRFSDLLSGGIARALDDIPVAAAAPECLLALAPGEVHRLGLALAALVLKDAGWRPRDLGGPLPPEELARVIYERRPEAVVLAASPIHGDAGARRAALDAAAIACRETGTRLVLGGRARWPRKAADAWVCDDFKTFRDWLDRGAPAGW